MVLTEWAWLLEFEPQNLYKGGQKTNSTELSSGILMQMTVGPLKITFFKVNLQSRPPYPFHMLAMSSAQLVLVFF